MVLTTQEVNIQGTAVSRGIAIGKPFFFTITESACPDYTIPPEGVDDEVLRYRQAVASSAQDVERLQEQLEGEGAAEAVAILDTHLQLIQDSLLTSQVEDEIRKRSCNAEGAFSRILQKVEKRFMALSDPFFRERFKDVQDIGRRIRGHLCHGATKALDEAPPKSIVIAQELPASDVAGVKTSHIGAFVTATGGETAHAALIAKAKGIPCVTRVDLALVEYCKDRELIVDGRTGEVILNPSPQTLAKYRRLQKDLRAYFKDLTSDRKQESETIDGYKVRLSANIEVLSELDMMHRYGGSGVGLFRSEYIFLTKNTIPSEAEQFRIYRRLVEKSHGLPLVIRVFDIGGDKFPEFDRLPHDEDNTLLGLRAIRFLLKERDIFKSQLRAILRATTNGDVSILFPMVSGVMELIEAKAVVKEVQEELEREGKAMGKNVPIGCMIEVPSAAIMCDAIARECDFLSIGTNDLIQYSLAADRGNHNLGSWVTPMHPAIFRMIKLIVTEATQHGVPVSVCGEAAADPRFTSPLLGLGVRELSVAPQCLPIIKNAIRSLNIVEASELAEKVLAMDRYDEIQELLTSAYRRAVPEDSYHNT